MAFCFFGYLVSRIYFPSHNCPPTGKVKPPPYRSYNRNTDQAQQLLSTQPPPDHKHQHQELDSQLTQTARRHAHQSSENSCSQAEDKVAVPEGLKKSQPASEITSKAKGKKKEKQTKQEKREKRASNKEGSKVFECHCKVRFQPGRFTIFQ